MIRSEMVEERVDVFWSHTGEQKPFVIELNRHLGGEGRYNNFLDTENIYAGSNFPEDIARAIKSCRLAVVVISPAFLEKYWPLKELHSFVEVGAAVLPVFYGLEPRDVKLNTASLKRNYDFIKDELLEEWKKMLLHIIGISGRVMERGIDVCSPIVQRLLSDIRLILAAQVLKEAQVNQEKLEVSCEDINDELSEENKMDKEYRLESARLLITRNAVRNLVRLLQNNSINLEVKAGAIWSLDNIFATDSFDMSFDRKAKQDAIVAGAVEALADLLMNKLTEVPAAYCLRNLLGLNFFKADAVDRLKAKDEKEQLAIQKKLIHLWLSTHDDDLKTTCAHVLEEFCPNEK